MAERRDAILEAAITVIGRNGVRGMRIEDVAAEAGVAMSLIYYHFKSRSGLIGATLDAANERTVSVAHSSVESSRDGLARVRALTLSEFDDEPVVRDRAIVWGEIAASSVFDEQLQLRVRDATQQWVDLVADAIRAGSADGSISRSVDAVDAATRITALIEGLTWRWLSGSISTERARAALGTTLEREFNDV